MAETRDSLHLTDLNLMQLNDVLRRIRDELDELHGLRTQLTYRTVTVTYKEAPIRIEDAAGTLIHAWGTKT